MNNFFSTAQLFMMKTHVAKKEDFNAWKTDQRNAIEKLDELIDKRMQRLILAMSKVDSIVTAYCCSGHYKGEPHQYVSEHGDPHGYLVWSILEGNDLKSCDVVARWMHKWQANGFTTTLERDTIPNLVLFELTNELVFTPCFVLRFVVETTEESCLEAEVAFNDLADQFNLAYS